MGCVQCQGDGEGATGLASPKLCEWELEDSKKQHYGEPKQEACNVGRLVVDTQRSVKNIPPTCAAAHSRVGGGAHRQRSKRGPWLLSSAGPPLPAHTHAPAHRASSR